MSPIGKFVFRPCACDVPKRWHCLIIHLLVIQQGQKKPVNVYRLVSQNTIEEKIVERAQQKLKLDAMVVQQGRLKEKDKVSKDEIMAAVRFGADTVFRSEESTITDEDIDVILERGAAKTKELQQKLSKAEASAQLAASRVDDLRKKVADASPQPPRRIREAAVHGPRCPQRQASFSRIQRCRIQSGQAKRSACPTVSKDLDEV